MQNIKWYWVSFSSQGSSIPKWHDKNKSSAGNREVSMVLNPIPANFFGNMTHLGQLLTSVKNIYHGTECTKALFQKTPISQVLEKIILVWKHPWKAEKQTCTTMGHMTHFGVIYDPIWWNRVNNWCRVLNTKPSTFIWLFIGSVYLL